MKIKKELTRIQRLLRNLVILVLIVVCIVVSYICFNKQEQIICLGWLSNLLLNLASGLAITSVFLFANEERKIRYNLQEAVLNLNFVVHRRYYEITDMENRTPVDRIKLFTEFMNIPSYIEVDYSIIERNKPELKAHILDYSMISREYIAEIMKQSTTQYTVDEASGEYINYEFQNGIEMTGNIIYFIMELKKNYETLMKLLR